MSKIEGKFRPMMTPEQKKKREKEMKRMDIIDPSYYYPQTICFMADQLPEIKDWEVGKEYIITLKVKQK